MPGKKSGLGKGLDSLIPNKKNDISDSKVEKKQEKENDSPKSGEIMVRINEVEPNRDQPRKDFDEDALMELADSIRQFGILQPLLVQKKKNYYEIAQFIRQEIKDKVDIPVSIGISSSKTLAKLASDKAKKLEDGVFLIGSRKIQPELLKTSIDEIWGIGRNLSALFRKNGILTAYELVQQNDLWLNKQIGIRGLEMKHELLGEMISPVDDSVKLPKSIQKTSALAKFTSDKEYLKNSLNYHIHRACVKLRKLDAKCFGISIYLRTKDFKVYCEKRVLNKATNFELEISDIIFELLDELYNPKILYRSTGVILDTFEQNSEAQLSIFDNPEDDIKKEKLTKCFDKLESRFGKNIIQTGFITDDV